MHKFITFFILISLNSVVFSQNYNVQESIFTNDSLDLYADIFIPHHPVFPKTGIAIIQGSGNSGRDNAWSRAFAEFLAENGYYVLLPDKRGSGKSQGDWKTASFHDLASDVIASVAHLRKEQKLNSVGVMGLSQGGHIAPLAGAESNTIDFVIDVSGAAVPLFEQILHEVVNTSKNEGLKPQQVAGVLELHVLMKNYLVTGNWKPLEEKYEELKSSDWAEFAATFPNDPDSWVWDFLKLNLNFDPLPYWKDLNQEVFIAYGSKDEDDNVPVYNSVYLLQDAFYDVGKTNYEIHVYPTGHAMYEDDRAELRKEFLGDILEWLQKVVD